MIHLLPRLKRKARFFGVLRASRSVIPAGEGGNARGPSSEARSTRHEARV